jgi:N-acetylglucosamine-6-phosphate deacetylase
LDRSAFAGSVATTNRLVSTVVNQAGIPLLDAVQMMTSTPARIIGADDQKGSLAAGKDADIVIFDNHIDIKMTIVNGSIVYQQKG